MLQSRFFLLTFFCVRYRHGVPYRSNDAPNKVITPNNGLWNVTMQWLNKNKVPDSKDGRPSVINLSIDKIEYRWHKDGKLERDNHDPAVLIFNRGSLEIYYLAWYVYGKMTGDVSFPGKRYEGPIYWYNLDNED